MNNDLLTLIKKIKQTDSLEDLQELKDFSDSVMRTQKREALLTLMAVSEEMGEEEIIKSLDDLKGYLQRFPKNK